MPTDVTVIKGRVAVKTITASGNESYDLGYHVQARVEPVEGILGLYELLRKLERNTACCIVRGKPKGQRHLNRRYLVKPGKDAPSFEATDVGWFCLDLDKVPAPPGFEDADPLSTVDQLLPPELQGYNLVWQYSSSHGLAGKEGTVSAHLWFLCDRPVACKSVKAWLKKLGVGDLALFNPVQPHYTARPIFQGVRDPLPQRLFLSGDEREIVTLPPEVVTCAELARLEREESDRRRREATLATQRRPQRSESTSTKSQNYALAALADAVKTILQAGEGGRHYALRNQAWSTYRFVLQGLIPEPVWESELRRAAEAVIPGHRHNEIDRLLLGAQNQSGDV
jgi:hypothetical protein